MRLHACIPSGPKGCMRLGSPRREAKQRGRGRDAGSNFSSGEGDKKAADFKGTSFGYSGDKVVSQRDIQRLVRRSASSGEHHSVLRAWATPSCTMHQCLHTR